MCNIYDFCIKDRTGIGHSLQTVEIPTICPTLFHQSVPLHFVTKLGLPLADDYLTDRNVTVDILVGLDLYWKFMLPDQVLLTEGLVAQKSVFGWILSGSWTTDEQSSSLAQLLCVNHVTECEVNTSWDLEISYP